MTFRAKWDDDLDCWCVYDERGAIVARSCADRHTAEDIAHAMSAAADLDPRIVVA